jgi:hypothetical protein
VIELIDFAGFAQKCGKLAKSGKNHCFMAFFETSPQSYPQNLGVKIKI